MRTVSILYFSSFSAGSFLVTLHRLSTAIFAPQCHQEDLVVSEDGFIYIFFFYLLILKGAGKILFCGNPVQAIRARREKLRVGGVRWRKETKKFLHLSEKNSVFFVNQISDYSAAVFHFLLAEEYLMSTEGSNKLYGNGEAILAVWHHQLVSSCHVSINRR